MKRILISKGNYPILSKLAQKLPVFPYVQNERSMLYIENLTEFVRLMVENEERGIFWPQNKEYSNTSELVKLIAEARGKKIKLVRGFEWAVKFLGVFTGMVNKAFGSLTYDGRMSEYHGTQYQLATLIDSINRTERS